MVMVISASASDSWLLLSGSEPSSQSGDVAMRLLLREVVSAALKMLTEILSAAVWPCFSSLFCSFPWLSFRSNSKIRGPSVEIRIYQ